jgi:V8-like Glu-specific endopeptidase
MKMLALTALTLLSFNALALPVAPHNALAPERVIKSKLMSRNALAYDFEGIVKLSNCSGALIQFSGQSGDSMGIVMTNGHCVQKPGGYLTPGEVWVNKPISRAMKIFDTNMKLFPIQATKVLYATMTNTDVTFYELNETFTQIEARTKVRPLTLDMNHPTQGMAIDIISGYWDKGYSCDIDSFIPQLREGMWTWFDSIRYTASCDTIGGTSGSPIIARGTRTVVGINNTSNEDGQNCTLNNPCEVRTDGSTVATQGVRYGEETFNFYTCLTPDFKFDLSLSSCQLPK